MRKYKVFFSILFGVMILSCNSTSQQERNQELSLKKIRDKVDHEGDCSPCDDLCLDIIGYGVSFGESDSVAYGLVGITPKEVLNYYWGYDRTAGEGIMCMDMKELYFDYAMDVYGECLKKLGYEKPNEETIKNQMKAFFKVDLNFDSKNIIYPSFCWRYVYDKKDREGRSAQWKEMEHDGSFALRPFWHSFLYDERYGIVVKQPSINGVVLGGKCKYNCNSDEFELGDSIPVVYNRKKIVETLHLNNFIFYGDEKSLHWLVEDSPNLLKDLFFLFGYDENPTINELVMKDVEEKVGGNSDVELIEEAYENLFASHDRDGRLRIHEGFLKFLKGRNPDDYRNIDMLLASYAGTMVSSLKDGDTSSFFPGFSYEERMIIAAYTEVYRNHDSCESDVFRQEWINNPTFARFIESNDYWGLPKLKEIVDKINRVCV
ncbi:MAG: hypothetical protein J6Y37_16850 [Paludibacteraceae bacterium]|nr:hypothetical protein [Paludibacteraceae bacterium]